jgi:beta-galactosidase
MFYYGVDYYPEHWPAERWPIDAQLMFEAGFNVVRLAEFAWSRLEPSQDRFNFEWLDQAIEILYSHGIRVILGTPSASPPPWLMHKNPEIFRVREDGLRVTYGNRRNYCPNNPQYHAHCQRIVMMMANHYSKHPAILGWQIDNELSNRCYCSVCANAFQEWLRQRYKTLEMLNERWGTVFWSHEYHQWEEIALPLTTGGSPNPSLALDFYRFCSDSHVAFQQKQVEVLRKECPDHLITHNLMGFLHDEIDYYDLTHNLDVVSLTHYPRSQWSLGMDVDPGVQAIAYDTARGLRGENFWVMEQQAGPGGWEMMAVTPRPGELRLWAYQAIAHGADGILFFRWRTVRFGTEQFWHGLLDYDGSLTRRYTEVCKMGQEIKKAGEQIAGSQVRAEIAFLLSYDARFAFQIQPHHTQFSYTSHFYDLYRAFFDRNIPIDIHGVSVDDHDQPDMTGKPERGFWDYKILIAPALFLLNQTLAEKLKNYVAQGGILMITPRTGVKDTNNQVVEQRLPGLLGEVCGIEVEEYDSLPEGVYNYLSFSMEELAVSSAPQVGIICEVLKPIGAEVVASYTRDFYAGKPAITLNHFGKGYTLYVGTLGEVNLYGLLADWLLRLAEVNFKQSKHNGVEACERWRGDDRLLFLINHSDEEHVIDLEREGINLLTGDEINSKEFRLAPKEVILLNEVSQNKSVY